MYKYHGQANCEGYNTKSKQRETKFSYRIFGNSKQALIDELKEFIDKFAILAHGDMIDVFVVENKGMNGEQPIVWEREAYLGSMGKKCYRKARH